VIAVSNSLIPERILKSTFWSNITQGAQAATSVLQAGVQAYNAIAPRAQVVTTYGGSANPIPTGSGLQTQSAPLVNIAQTPNGGLSQGSNAAPISNNMLLIGGGVLLLVLIVAMMRK
jgi:hypothetical protein